MFDSSWLELSFVAMLALVIIGPKDMPRLFKVFGHITRKAQRTYQELKGSVNQLEKEIALAANEAQQTPPWEELMPEHLRLPEDYTPGSMSREQFDALKKAQTDYKNQVMAAFDSQALSSNEEETKAQKG